MIECCDLATLHADAADLLAMAAGTDIQFGAAWLGAVAAHALPPGSVAQLLAYREAGRLLAVLPLRRGADGRLAALTAPYTTRFRPAVAAAADTAALRRAGHAFGVACRAAGPLRLDALEADWPGWPPLLAGLRRAGLLPLRFAAFGNWHADVAGLGWEGYLAARPGALRSTIRRRLAHAARDPALRLDVVSGGAALAPAIAAYAAVHAASWKPPEPYPDFIPAFLHAAAAAGGLRLGVLRQGGAPVAAQIWTVVAGTATLHKLAHAQAAAAGSPGTLLTALLLRRLLAEERVTALDFGRGDDPYKAGWAGQRRQRLGVLACPPWQPAGLAALARHGLGRGLAALRRRKNPL